MKGLIYSNQSSMFGKPEIIGFGDGAFSVKEISRNNANDKIINNHYSEKFYNGSYIHLGVFINSEMVGVLQYGYAMNPSSGKNIVEGTENTQYLELNRMWLDDVAPKNSESKAISYSIKYIRNQHKTIRFIQSFADQRCGLNGIVYQSANFVYYGEFKSDFYEYEGKFYHNIIMTANRGKIGAMERVLQANKDKCTKHTFRQFRYIYWIKPQYRKQCKLAEKPYPKFYNELI